MKNYREKYQDFLEKTGQDMSYADWLELQLSGNVVTNKFNGKKIKQYNKRKYQNFIYELEKI